MDVDASQKGWVGVMPFYAAGSTLYQADMVERMMLIFECFGYAGRAK